MFSNFSLQCLRAPSQIPSVLDRFNFNPESAPKISIRFNALVISCLVLRNRVVSSASCEIFRQWFFPSNFIQKPFIELSYLILHANISTAITKIRALHGQP